MGGAAYLFPCVHACLRMCNILMCVVVKMYYAIVPQMDFSLSFFSYSSVEGRLSCFQLFAVTNVLGQHSFTDTRLS